MLDLELIRADISNKVVKSFGNNVDAKSIYSNNVLESCLIWLGDNLEYYLNESFRLTQVEIKQLLIQFLSEYVDKPKSSSILDTVTFDVIFNWALNRIIKFIVNKVFEMIFVGETLELNPKYVQNNPVDFDLT